MNQASHNPSLYDPSVVRNTLSNQFLHQLDALKITKLIALKCSYTFTSLSPSPIIVNNQISCKAWM